MDLLYSRYDEHFDEQMQIDFYNLNNYCFAGCMRDGNRDARREEMKRGIITGD